MEERYRFKPRLYFKQQLVVIMRMQQGDEFNPARKKLKTPFLRRANHSPSFLKTNTHHKSCLLSSTKPHHFTYLQQLQAKTIEKSTHNLHPNLDRQLVRKKSSLIELGLRYIHLQEKYASLLEKTNNLTCNTQPDFEECGYVEERSRSNRKRLDRLKIIRARLANIRLPHCLTSPNQKGRWSRSLK